METTSAAAEQQAQDGVPEATTTTPVSICRRLWWELRPSTGFFSPLEPNGRTLDLAACFSGGNSCCGWLFRLVLWLWSVQVLALDVYHYPPHNLWVYMGYLTHWGHVLSICYLFCSFLCSVVIRKKKKTMNDNDDAQPEQQQLPLRLIHTTWLLYSLTAPLELAICMLYWSAIAAGPSAFSYFSLMEHGGIAIFVWLDGTGALLTCTKLGGAAIPVRAKHIIFLTLTCCTYLFWTGVDAVLGIGNGEWGPAYTDDALYPVLNWNSDSQLAATVSAVAICGVAPACFFLCWLASLYGRNIANDNNGCCSCCCRCDGSRRPLLPLDVDDAGAADYKVLEDAPIV